MPPSPLEAPDKAFSGGASSYLESLDPSAAHVAAMTVLKLLADERAAALSMKNGGALLVMAALELKVLPFVTKPPAPVRETWARPTT